MRAHTVRAQNIVTSKHMLCALSTQVVSVTCHRKRTVAASLQQMVGLRWWSVAVTQTLLVRLPELQPHVACLRTAKHLISTHSVIVAPVAFRCTHRAAKQRNAGALPICCIHYFSSLFGAWFDSVFSSSLAQHRREASKRPRRSLSNTCQCHVLLKRQTIISKYRKRRCWSRDASVAASTIKTRAPWVILSLRNRAVISFRFDCNHITVATIVVQTTTFLKCDQFTHTLM